MKLSMSSVSVYPAACAEHRADELGFLSPSWVRDLLGREARWIPVLSPTAQGISLEVTRGGGFCFASVRIRNARDLDRASLRAATAFAYRRIEAELRVRNAPHPVRLWNHIPGIHDPMGEGQDRYMVFNAGRYEALSAWFGRETFDTRVATASGVGHDGQDLVIHCLAAERPGRAVDNPRQTKPYDYSRRFGPLPPCFARATVLDEREGGEPLLLVGGTASIVGEESVHLEDLERQTEETLTNLAVLVRAAAGEDSEAGGRAEALARYREVRVYFPHPSHRDMLEALLAEAFPGVEEIEWVRADLCRGELLVEIEGIAEGS